MGDQQQSSTAVDEFNEFLIDLARHHGLDGDQSRRLRRRAHSSFDSMLPLDLDEAKCFFRYGPPRVLSKIFEYLSVDVALRLLDRGAPEEQGALANRGDLQQITQRVLAAEYLVRPETPLYSLQELSNHLRNFAVYLENHRQFLIDTGLPSRSYPDCRWLYLKLGRLYDVKQTKLPWPWDELRVPVVGHPGVTSPPYTWCRRNKRGSLESCSYAEADWLGGYSSDEALKRDDVADRTRDRSQSVSTPAPPNLLLQAIQAVAEQSQDEFGGPRRRRQRRRKAIRDFRRLESLRRKLLDLKIELLRALADAVQLRRRETLDECLHIVRNALSDDEAEFLLQMDRTYLQRDILNRVTYEDDWKMIPGGLTSMLEVVAHCGQEIILETMASTRQQLGELLPRMFANSNDPERHHPYFWAVREARQGLLDKALDHFLYRDRKEVRFFRQFQHRVSKLLFPNETVEVTFRVNRMVAEAWDSKPDQYAVLLTDATERHEGLAETEMSQKKRWTSPEAEKAIARYRRKYRKEFDAFRARIAKDESVAIKEATRIFGRNVIAKHFGMSGATVSNLGW
jgi:hypothetical protein